MVISSGTRGLGLVSRIGAVFALAGIGLALYFVTAYLTGQGAGQQGWKTTMVVLLVSSGAIMLNSIPAASTS